MVYSPKLVRFIITPNDDFDLDFSYAVIKPLKDWPECSFEMNEQAEQIILSTEQLEVRINKKPYKVSVLSKSQDIPILFEDADNGYGACFSLNGKSVRSYKKIRENDHFFGFGEKTGPLDKKGESMVMHGGEYPYKGNKDPLYQNHPYFITIRNGIAHAIFFDNISKTTFNMGKTNKDEYFFDAGNGDLNFYIIYGPELNEILELYTELTGRMEMPPKWAIGYHQCRYSYKNEKEVKKITSKFRENKVPCDVIWYDIHYMDEYRDFTYDKKRFPDLSRLIGEIRNNGFRSVIMVDPALKIEEGYKPYDEIIEKKYYATRENGKPTVGLVWPGLTVFPDFTREEVREWWANMHNFYFDLGIEGIWNDMNEPALSVNPLISWIKRLNTKDMYFHDQGRHTYHDDGKNIYALCMTMATFKAFKKYRPNRRVFLLTRSGYSGVQRYAAIWTGDNWTNWKNITLAIRMLLNMNLSAQSFVGSDVGGFAGILKFVPFILRDKKQFARWIQSGVFYPFCRVHTAVLTKSQDPFSYGKKVQAISKKYIELRYELMPYWYNLFYKYHKKGTPIMRPLFYHTPEDEKCYDKTYENQFLLGKDILVVPIGKRNIKNKLVYLPKGTWIHYWTLKEYKGNQEHIIPVTLSDIPIFIRKGAIIPTQPVVEYVGQKPIDTLILKIFKGEDGSSSSIKVYEDDGESMDYMKKDFYYILDITCEYKEKDSELVISKEKGSYKPPWKQVQYIIYGEGKKLQENKVNFSDNMNISF